MSGGINGIELRIEMGEPMPSVIHNNAVAHLNSAAMFARDLHQREAVRDLATPMDDYSECRSLADASIVMSCAAIEANLNEVLSELSADDAVLRKIDDTKGLLEKHNEALKELGHSPMKIGEAPCQAARVLTRLRNKLVHARPLRREIGNQHPELKLEQSLEKQRFALYPGLPTSEPIYPRRYCSHGCAEWAVMSATSMIVEFNVRCHPRRNERNLWSPKTIR